MAEETQTSHALLILHGLSGDPAQSVVNVQFSSLIILMNHLEKLQSEYLLTDLEDGEEDKITFERISVPSKKYPGKFRDVINCFSYSDWHYAAHFGVVSDKVPLLHLL